MSSAAYKVVPLEYPDKLQVICQVLRDPFLSTHWHTDHELMLGLSGVSAVTIDGRHVALGEGDLAFVNQGSLHAVEGRGALLLMINFDASFGDLAFIDEPYQAGKVYFSFQIGRGIDKNEKPQLLDWVTTIAKRYFEHDFAYRLDCPGILLQFLAYMCRHGLWTYINNPSSHTSGDRLIRDFLSYIHRKEHFSKPLTLEAAAGALHVSPSTVSRALHTTLRFTFREYLTFVRVNEAMRQLNCMAPEDKITEIAMDCGFASIPSFYRTFKQHTGMNPSEYRQQHKLRAPDGALEARRQNAYESLEALEAFRVRNLRALFEKAKWVESAIV